MVGHKAQLILVSGINTVVITARGPRWLWMISLSSKKLSHTWLTAVLMAWRD